MSRPRYKASRDLRHGRIHHDCAMDHGPVVDERRQGLMTGRCAPVAKPSCSASVSPAHEKRSHSSCARGRGCSAAGREERLRRRASVAGSPPGLQAKRQMMMTTTPDGAGCQRTRWRFLDESVMERGTDRAREWRRWWRRCRHRSAGT